MAVCHVPPWLTTLSSSESETFVPPSVHSFLYSASPPTALPLVQPAFLPSILHTHLPSRLPSTFPSFLPFFLPASTFPTSHASRSEVTCYLLWRKCPTGAMARNTRRGKRPKGGASAVGGAKGAGRTPGKSHYFWVVFVILPLQFTPTTPVSRVLGLPARRGRFTSAGRRAQGA